MRISPAARVLGGFLVLAVLAGCNNSAPVGSRGALFQTPPMNDYQRQVAAADARRGVPYTIAPESPGAPLAAPMATQPLPMTPAPAAAQPLPVTPAPGAADAPRPGGVADTTTFTPIPFGQRPAGAEIAPVGTTEMVTVASVPTGQSGGPNVVAYALQTTHAVGTERYRRINPIRFMRWEATCRGFVNQDAAQEAFLAAGGPERDPQNLDPDGDGFACWWDPAVYRRAAAIPAPVQGAATE
jgi:hypothetical protein